MPIVICTLENPKQHSYRELRFLSCANSCPALSQTTVCERVGQELAQLKNLNSLKLCCLGFSRMRMTMGIVIFHIDVPLAPDGVTSKTLAAVISIVFYLGSQTLLIFAFILTEEFWKNCFRRHAFWSQRDANGLLTSSDDCTKSIDVLVPDMDEIVFDRKQREALLRMMNVGGGGRKAFKVKIDGFSVTPTEGVVEPGAISTLTLKQNAEFTKDSKMTVEFGNVSGPVHTIPKSFTVPVKQQHLKAIGGLRFRKDEQNGAKRSIVLANFTGHKKAYMVSIKITVSNNAATSFKIGFVDAPDSITSTTPFQKRDSKDRTPGSIVSSEKDKAKIVTKMITVHCEK
ncbi:hypothetical protein PRIPAC_78335 [Pristionchus pacificus]|uniref:MSP domain-containing protein n=1 Tax=Pristionchus pacificus TaxID=54126 RepID=A0A2A6BVF0_PRIPA|nr:hypothetical protein PRIPAC_78335 [Pristionchus pacificus]|eukprot:PDM69879.1 MSP domain-containing protein [Pristionchus pacificus]